MVMLFVSDPAVRSDQLNAVVLDPIDGADVNAVGADHFHMLTNILEAAHCLLLAGDRGSTLRLSRRFTAASSSYACLGDKSSFDPACCVHLRRLSPPPCPTYALLSPTPRASRKLRPRPPMLRSVARTTRRPTGSFQRSTWTSTSAPTRPECVQG